MKATYHVPPNAFTAYEMAEDTRLDDAVVSKGTKLTDVFPDGMMITKRHDGKLSVENEPRFVPAIVVDPVSFDPGALSGIPWSIEAMSMKEAEKLYPRKVTDIDAPIVCFRSPELLTPTSECFVFYNPKRDCVVFLTSVRAIEEPKKLRRKIGRYIRRGKLPKGNYVMDERRR